MDTNLSKLLEASIPPFANDQFESFSEHELNQKGARVKRDLSDASVDLSLVAGTQDARYQGMSWLELLGNPPGTDPRILQRIRGTLLELKSNSDYYLSRAKKNAWYFCLLEGRYYVLDGMHRTVVGRFLFECNSLPPVVFGVSVREYELPSHPNGPALRSGC